MHTSTQRIRIRRAAGFALVLTLTSSFTLTASSQQGDAEEERSIEEQVQELVADLEERRTELEDFQKKVQEADGTAAMAMLEKELADRRSRYRRSLSELVDLVMDGEDAGAEVAQGRSTAAQLLEEDAKAIHEELREMNSRALERLDAMGKGSAEEVEKTREDWNASLPDSNRLFAEQDANIDAREKLGLDVEADAAEFAETLESRSVALAAALQQVKDQIDGITSRPGSSEDAAAQKELASLTELRDLLAEAQHVTVDLMDERGMDTAELRQGIISATGELSDDILDKEVAVGLIEEWTSDAADWLRTNGARLVFNFLVFLLILVAFWFLARIGRGIARRALDRSAMDVSSLGRAFIIKMTGRLIVLLGVIIAIAQLGIEVGPLLAGLGIAGFVIGFALQDTLSNFASGIMILMYRPFDVGDVVEAGGVMGTVDKMNLVSTMVLTPDNQLLVVPNNQIWGGVIRNVTHQDKRRVDLMFGIGYSDDIPKAEAVLTEIVAGHEKVLKDPAPVVRLHELADSSVNFVVRPWASTGDYWDVYWDITREVKQRFDAEGISIPFPQRDVHVYRENDDDATGFGGGVQRSQTSSTAQTVVPGESDEDA